MNQHSILSLALLCCLNSALAENWPQFRGPTGQGLSTETGLPLEWSATTNVAWKTAIPGESWSSPIVWKDRIFVTTATDNGVSCHVICLDRVGGKILWDREVFQQVTKRKEARNTYATPTPATDGERVYAAFADGSLVALKFDGSVVWTNRDFPHYSQHGLGTSPILYQDLLIMARDGSGEGEDKQVGWKIPWDQAAILALDKNTGKLRWKGKRGLSRIGHPTPIVLHQDGGDQLLSNAGDVVQGFDLQTGERLWSIYGQGEGVVPSLATGDGLVFSASGFEKPTIRAIRTGGHGDVTKTHLSWEQNRGVPMQASFIYAKPCLYSVIDGGVAYCFKAETGEIVWQQRVGGATSASPVHADGRLYFLSEAGETAVVEAKPEFKLVAKNSLDEKCQASLAVSGRQLFIRTEKNLYCIGESTKARQE